MLELEIVYLNIDELTPYENNAKEHTPEQIEHIANSINDFEMIDPIGVWGEDNIIVEGHGRVLACKKLGMEIVPCIRLDHLTDEQRRGYALAHNKTSLETLIDKRIAALEIAAIPNIDMSVFGFDVPDIGVEDIVADDDFKVEPPEDPKAKQGDIYQLGNHRLMCGDSTSKRDVARLMGDATVDMVFTDPPWNVDLGGTDHPNWKSRSIMNDSMPTEDFRKFMANAFEAMISVVKEGCMLYVVMSPKEWGNLKTTLDEVGCHWSSTIIWAKDSFVISRKDYHTQYESIWYGWYGSPRLHPLEDRGQSDLWEFPRPKRSEEHPTMKPIPLVAQAIKNSSNKGAVILDMFGGSGTTLLAAEQTERQCCMMELDPKYIDVIIKRWEAFTGETAKKINPHPVADG